MKTILKKIYSSKDNRSILLLMSGSLLAQIITLFASPIITRLYTPEEFGEYSLIIVIVSIFAVIINGRYDAIIVNVPVKDYAGIVKLSILFSLAFSTLISLIFLIINNYVNAFANFTFFWIWSLLIIYGFTNVFNNINNRNSNFKLLNKIYVKRIGYQNIFTIVIGIFSNSGIGLILGQIIGSLFGFREQMKSFNKKKRFQFNTIKLLELAKKYREQLLYSVPASLFNAIAYSLINFSVYILFTSKVLGLYALAFKILGLPLSIFSSNISKVFFSKATLEKKEKGFFWYTTKKILKISITLSILVMVSIILMAPSIFGFIFGEEWREAGKYVQILAPMFGMRLIVGSIAQTYIIANKQKVDLLFQILFIFVLVIISIVSGILRFSVYEFLFSITIIYTLIYLVQLISMIYYSKKRSFNKI